MKFKCKSCGNIEVPFDEEDIFGVKYFGCSKCFGGEMEEIKEKNAPKMHPTIYKIQKKQQYKMQ